MPVRRRAASHRQLAAALALTLVPGLALAAFGLLELSERSQSLRTNYAATTVLVRDRLLTELARLEALVAADIANPPPSVDREPSAWLTALAARHAWLAAPFLLDETGAVVTTRAAEGWVEPESESDPPGLTAALRDGEQAELAAHDFAQAERHYQRALAVAATPGQHGQVLVRLGRTLLKQRRVDPAIVVYQRLATLPPATVDPHGVPYGAIARLQIAEARAATQGNIDRQHTQEAFVTFVLDHPWDLAHGYAYYLDRAVEGTWLGDNRLNERVSEARLAIQSVDQIKQELAPRWRGTAPCSPTLPHRVSAVRAGESVLIACLSATLAGRHAMLGYTIRPAILTSLLTETLSTVGLGDDLHVRVRDGSSREGVSLAAADRSPTLPGWEVASFHRDGRSIDQLVVRERVMYGTFIVAMVGALIAGVTFATRAAAREAELSRLKSDLVSNVSHELKTPLSLIRMFGETLESGIVSDEARRQEFYGIIRRESERLTGLINNVLDVARIDAGTKQYAFAAIDLTALVNESFDAYHPFFERLGFDARLVTPARPLLIRGDRDAIAQALVNLLHNAIKYSAAAKQVNVTLDEGDGLARITVADRGIGIALAEIPRIFEKFYRVPGVDGAAPPGSGLGLAIVKHAMEAHGGCVEVESVEGRGSVFALVFPHAAPAQKSSARVIDDRPLRVG